MRNSIIISVFLVLSASLVSAQEVLTGLSDNPSLRQSGIKKASQQDTTLSLPFFDDFSDGRTYPHPNRWSDRDAFVNQDFGKFPVTVGVATLDAINEYGDVYEDASVFPFEADHLTSHPVRLDSIFSPQPRALTPEDSLYFSFYYQPAGFGNDPQPADSLILQFFSIHDNDTIIIEGDTPEENDTTILEGWNRVWAAGGSELDDFADSLRYFKRVMIPITDSAKYFNEDFRFRFVNYASLSDNSLMSWQSNVDQWNIDYVELDRNRSAGDTIHNDVAFVSGAPSFLKRYSSMPFWQYRANFVNEMQTSVNMLMANLDDEPHNVAYSYHVLNPSGDTIDIYEGGFLTIAPFIEQGYPDNPSFANPNVELLFPFTTDSISFLVEHVLSSDASLSHRVNDTVRYTQHFKNYYAYDDGTPEAGYGLTSASAMLAYQFQLNEPDTLKAVKFFFNKTKNNANQQFFYLTIWNDNNGKPGEIIYQSDRGIMPEFSDNLNQFVSYEIDPVIFNSKNTVFYVGWQQTTDDILNIGFDFSRNSREHIFYNTSGTWNASRYEGSLMIRPVFGSPESSNKPDDDKNRGALKVSPNPANQNTPVTIQLPPHIKDKTNLSVDVYSMTGEKVYSGTYQEEIRLQNLSRGIFLLRVSGPHLEKSYSKKIVITQ